MKLTNCSSPNKALFEHKILPSLYIFVFIVGLVANGLGLMSLLHNWKKLGKIKIFVLNLGLADILYLLTLPLLMAYYFNGGKWIFGDFLCKVTRFCFNLNLYCSIGFLTCISVYRYLSIVHPLRVKGRITTTHSVLITLMVWMLVGAQSLPDMFFPKTYGNMSKCFDSTSDSNVESYLKYSLGWTIIGFCIPFFITLGCYGHIAFVLCHKNTINKVLKQKSLRLFFISILLFSVCYTPYHVFKNLSFYSKTLRKLNICPNWDAAVFSARQASRGLVSLNSALNPLVYLHVYNDITAQIRQLFQRLLQTFRFNPSAKPVPQTDEDEDEEEETP